MAVAEPKLRTVHSDYEDFFDFANKADWMLLTCITTGDKSTETWLTPAGRILRVTRDVRSVLSVQ